MTIDKLYPEILSKSQKEILETLSFFKKYKFYLAGGTALALQIGHRTSVDFDFYKETKIRPLILLSEFKKNFINTKIKITEATSSDFRTVIRNVDLTAFYYPYPLIRDFVKFSDINLASVEDITAMKIIAIVQRGRQRDFFDIYYLLKRYTLGQILEFVQEKHPEYDIYTCLRALIYFQDADGEGRDTRIKLFDKTATWSKVKKVLLIEVKNFCKNRGIRI
ncbi:nucleotidyl transferase AbiEii/AbiGii toxin family protein [Patescibacteria group bacterium]|nr:nucleotidyl transferase AbiEii/AbiGii toxin family protein [Patescibacteria group bacterium]MBU4512362.1 nucleotidyl transferase AbiEii/AbiGii toxin family protein [Patescibacteria group bacterium]MCG2692788.1 nucleotidyl transferase AbiEii/AbiGii toxin family protein [Candidatus Parcubacteria bacterium]